MIKILDITLFNDSRGSLKEIFNNNLPFTVKRMYAIYPKKDVKRGLHGHRKEYKAFWVAQGLVEFVIVSIKDSIHRTLIPTRDNLLIVEPNNYNGFASLTDNSIVLCLSSMTLEESLKDDIRVPVDHFGDIW